MPCCPDCLKLNFPVGGNSNTEPWPCGSKSTFTLVFLQSGVIIGLRFGTLDRGQIISEASQNGLFLAVTLSSSFAAPSCPLRANALYTLRLDTYRGTRTRNSRTMPPSVRACRTHTRLSPPREAGSGNLYLIPSKSLLDRIPIHLSYTEVAESFRH